MKTRTISFIFSALALVGCSGNGSTTLTGKFAPDDVPSEVHVTVAGIDTVVSVTEGTFRLKVPVAKSELGLVESDCGRLQFISDGSDLLADYSGERPRVTSDNPKSLTRAFNAYLEKSVSLVNQVVGEDDASKRAYEAYMAFQKKTISENRDNFIGLYALQNVYFDYEPSELKKTISALGKDLKENEFVQSLLTAADAQIATAEGKMFSDFELEGIPQGGNRLSDYVGKGKYILAVFWSSWCVPYRSEVPNLMEVYEKFGGEEFDILGIAVWDDDEESSRQAAESFGTPWPQMYGGQRVPTSVYGVQNIPYIILFGPDGTIIKRDLRGEAIEDEVSKALAAKR